MFHLRVNYDVTTWGLIGEQLSRDHLAIPALQRATIICDVADLARTGYVLQVIREQIYIFGKTIVSSSGDDGHGAGVQGVGRGVWTLAGFQGVCRLQGIGWS